MPLDAAKKDGQTVTAQGEMVGAERIQGVKLAPVRPVISGSGATAELFRVDGPFAGFEARQVIYCPMRALHTSDWHMHRAQNDVVVPLAGEIHIGLYDDRDGSPTQGISQVVRISTLRMGALHIPCGVWHALKNPGHEPASYIVLTDQMYIHADPDDWRLKRGEPALHGIL